MHLWISGSEYVPSGGLTTPINLEEEEEHMFTEIIYTSGIDPNEHNEAQRSVIHEDEVNFIRRKANPNEWSVVFTNLEEFLPGKQLNEKVICNLLNLWWPLRFDPGGRPVYLAFAEVHSISAKIISGGQVNASSLRMGSSAAYTGL